MLKKRLLVSKNTKKGVQLQKNRKKLMYNSTFEGRHVQK